MTGRRGIGVLAVLAIVLAGTMPAVASTGSTYAVWSTAAPNDSPATPHNGYATNTNKCAVCHAVHNAKASGSVLLPTSPSVACVYCHVDANIGGVTIVYDGEAPVYYAFIDRYSHNRTNQSDCVACHSVHGANTVDGAHERQILKDWPKDGSFRAYSTFALANWPDPKTVTDHDGQITAWCTACHKYYVQSYDTTIQWTAINHMSTPPVSWAYNDSHVMTDLAGGYGNSVASTRVQDATVAYAPSSDCRDCHDAGETEHGPGLVVSSFPHYTPGFYRFMTVGSSVAASGSTNTTGTVDGLCLKCHRGDATSGVGFDF